MTGTTGNKDPTIRKAAELTGLSESKIRHLAETKKSLLTGMVLEAGGVFVRRLSTSYALARVVRVGVITKPIIRLSRI